MGIIRNISKKQLVYVIDDSIIFRQLLKERLGHIENLEVKTFSSAEECFKKGQEHPNLVLLDFYLNGDNKNNMNSHEVIAVFEELEYPPKVVLVSSETNHALLEEYKDYRNIDFIIKSDLAKGNFSDRIKKQLVLPAN